MKIFTTLLSARRVAALGFVLLAATAGHASVAGGAVRTWGSNDFGELGDGTVQDRTAPVAVSGLSNGVTAVAVGQTFTLAIQDGSLFAWGNNDRGSLGDGTTTSRSTPALVYNLESGVMAVSGGSFHGLAVRDGVVYAWGNNQFGQFGDGTKDDGEHPEPHISTAFGSGVSAVSGGYLHTLVLRGGALYASGYGVYGQLGNGAITGSLTPVAVSAPLDSGVSAVSAGTFHNLAIKNGALYAWGNNDYGELGNGTNTRASIPQAVPGLTSGVTFAAAGFSHSLAVQNGFVYGWGDNGRGELGNGTTTRSLTPIKIDPTDLHDIVAVTAGVSSSFALSADGSLWVWGYNGKGELGLGTTTESYKTPQHLLPPAGSRYTALNFSSGSEHAVAILSTAPAFFDGQTALSNGVYYLQFPSGNPFGYYAFLTDPHYIYHFDLGYEYVFDAQDGQKGVYFYDFTSSTFFYTSLNFPFPYLYDFTLGAVLYYYPDPSNPGRYNTNGVRYFFNTKTGQIITK